MGQSKQLEKDMPKPHLDDLGDGALYNPDRQARMEAIRQWHSDKGNSADVYNDAIEKFRDHLNDAKANNFLPDNDANNDLLNKLNNPTPSLSQPNGFDLTLINKAAEKSLEAENEHNKQYEAQENERLAQKGEELLQDAQEEKTEKQGVFKQLGNGKSVFDTLKQQFPKEQFDPDNYKTASKPSEVNTWKQGTVLDNDGNMLMSYKSTKEGVQFESNGTTESYDAIAQTLAASGQGENSTLTGSPEERMKMLEHYTEKPENRPEGFSLSKASFNFDDVKDEKQKQAMQEKANSLLGKYSEQEELKQEQKAEAEVTTPNTPSPN